MSETYRLARERYQRERAAAFAACGGYRQRRESLAFSAEELQAVDASMKRYETERLERLQALTGVKGKLRDSGRG